MNEPTSAVGNTAVAAGKEAPAAAAPTRHCVLCWTAIGGIRRMYCDEHRIQLRRMTWRESKRRKKPLKGIVA